MASVSPVSPPRAAWSWAWAGALAGTLLASIVFAPASWVAGAVARASDGRVVLADPRGTVWRGSAQLQLTGGAGSTDVLALPTRLEWTARPRWNGAMVELASPCCAPDPVAVRIGRGWGTTRLTFGDGATYWPSALLAGLGTPWNTLQLDGDLLLSTQGLSVEWVEGRLAIAGRAQLQAQRMSSRLSTLRPMGSYRITVLGGDTPSLQLETLEGSLQMSGSGQWVGSRLRFSGTATAAPDREEALSNLLNIIGRRSGARSIITIG